MRQAVVPQLPPEVTDALTRAAFAAEEGTMHAWRRLTRTWSCHRCFPSCAVLNLQADRVGRVQRSHVLPAVPLGCADTGAVESPQVHLSAPSLQ